MRLTDQQHAAIRQAVTEAFGADALVWLFGSRVDDSQRGGDIDLLIKTSQMDINDMTRAEIGFLTRLQMTLGEQKIDVLLDCPSRKTRPPFLPSPKKRAFCCERPCFNTTAARCTA